MARFRIRAPARIVRLIEGNLGVTGDIAFTHGGFTLSCTAPIAIVGSIATSGDVGWNTAVASFPLVHTAPIALSGVLGTTGNLRSTIPKNIVRTAGPSITGALTTTGNVQAVTPSNQPPVWGSADHAEFNLIRGSSIDLHSALRFVDPNGDPMTFAIISGIWPNGVTLNESTGLISATVNATPGLTGDLTVSADDGYAGAVPFNVVRSVGPSLNGAMGIAGNIQAVAPNAFNIDRTSNISLSGVVHVSGNLAYATSQPGEPVTPFYITSPTTKPNAPWTFGHPIKQGDVPAGLVVTAPGEAIQCVIKSAWGDGSAKLVILSGRKSLTANVRTVLNLATGSNSGTPIALSALQALIANDANTVALGAFGTCDLFDAVGSTSTYTPGNVGNKKWSAGLIRQWISGAQMSEWHFYTPAPSDDHLAVFWNVRLYAGNEIEIDIVVENSWLLVPSPTEKVYTPVVTINGTARGTFAQVTHLHHTRWSRNFWFDPTMPEIVPSHDHTYLRSTKLVPNYNWTTPTSAAFVDNTAVDSWAALLSTTTPEPLSNGTAFTEGGEMGDYGYDESIGLLPRWEALYCTSSDARAYRSTVGNARCYGGFGVHYRDETTLRPLLFASYPTLVMNGTNCAWKPAYGPGGSSTGSYTPAPGGGRPRQFTATHHHMPGYLAYLLTGKHHFLEQLQLIATGTYLSMTDGGVSWSHRNFSDGIIVGQRRQTGWGMRTLAAAAAVSPSSGAAPDVSLKTNFVNSYAANATYWCDRWATPGGANYNSWGLFWGNAPLTFNGGMATSVWESDFWFQSLCFGKDIDPSISGTPLTKLNTLITWLGQSIVGRLGTTDYDYRHACQYAHRIAEGLDETTLYNSWAQVFTGTFGVNAWAPGQALVIDPINTPLIAADLDSNYWGNFHPAIAYAVDHGIAGAGDARARMIGASNYSNIAAAAFNDNPLWGVAPRSELTPYYTTFPLTENPLSEGDKWINGKNGPGGGLDWNDIATANGRANATHAMVEGTFDDCIAHLSAGYIPFSGNQWVQGSVYRNGGYNAGHEIELYVRFLITPHNARGYEAYWNIAANDIYLVRWNGPLNDFTQIPNGSVHLTTQPVTGDVFRLEINGSTLTVKVNGTPVLVCTDSTWATGQPGLGQNPYGPGNNFYDWAFQDWSAGNL